MQETKYKKIQQTSRFNKIELNTSQHGQKKTNSQTLMEIGTDCKSIYISNYHTICVVTDAAIQVNKLYLKIYAMFNHYYTTCY